MGGAECRTRIWAMPYRATDEYGQKWSRSLGEGGKTMVAAIRGHRGRARQMSVKE